MDENSCENETSESVDGQKEKEAENVSELENVGVKINTEDKRLLNQVSDQSRSTFDGSGPSTDFSPAKDEDDSDEKRISSLVNIQTEKSVALVKEYETGTKKTVEPEKYEQDENEPDLKDSSASTSKKTVEPEKYEQDENEPSLKDSSSSTELLEPSPPIQDNLQYPKIPQEEDQNRADTSTAIYATPPGYEERQEIQPHVRLAPGVEEKLTTRRPSVGPPPSYSFVMKQKKKLKSVPSVDPLIRDTRPPPTYSSSRGIYLTPDERICNFPSFAEPMWRSHSQPALCPRCGIIVLTTTHTHDSKATHVAALALCLFGCWPCCLLPYCLNVCKNTYHHCPICQTFLGLCRPW